MRWQATAFSLVLFVMWSSHAACAAEYTNANAKGPFKCGFSLYSWPSSTDANPVEAVHGFLKLTGDGSGNWSDGSLRFSIDGDNCAYKLQTGSYQINPDGTGVSRTTWFSPEALPQDCVKRNPSGYLTNFGGMSHKVSAGDADVNIFVMRDAKVRQFSVGPAGYMVGTCQPDR